MEPEDRFQLFGDVDIDLPADAQLRLTALYGRTETVLHTSPSFLPTIAASDNAAFGGTGLFTIPTYAPALIDYCARFGADAGCSLDDSGAPDQPALAFPVRFRPTLAGGNPLFDNDRGSTVLDYITDAYQFTGELTVPVTEMSDLTISATYSKYDRFYEVGDSFVDFLQNSLAGFGGESCAFADPATRAGLSVDELAAIAGTQGCTFYNPFSTGVESNRVTGVANPNFAGLGTPTDLDLTPGAGLVNDTATYDHFYNVWGRTATTTQWVADAVYSSMTGIALPGGLLEFAVGAQFRRDSFARTFESGNNLDVLPCPGSVLNADEICDPEPGALGFIGAGRNFDVSTNIWAVFAEVQLPITDRLFAQASARYEDYGGAVGSSFDPQFRVRYDAANWLTLRGGVGTTFRGPPPNNTDADAVILTFIGGAFRAVDILANPDLSPESATTYSAGAVVDMGGFRASLDYWRYDFTGAIENEPVGGIVSALFGAGGADNCGDPAFAALEARFTFSGDVCGASNVQRLATFATNTSSVLTSGVDFAASYDWGMGRAALQVGVNGAYVFEYRVSDVTVEGITVQPAFDAAGKLNFQTTAYPIPQLKGQSWAQAELGRHALRVRVNHVDGYTDQRGASIFGANNGTLAGAVVSEGKNIVSYTTVDAIWRTTLASHTTISLALLNIFDAAPPFVRLDQNYDPFTADALGFTAKIGISQAF